MFFIFGVIGSAVIIVFVGGVIVAALVIVIAVGFVVGISVMSWVITGHQNLIKSHLTLLYRSR